MPTASLRARELTVTRGRMTTLDDVAITLLPRHRVGIVGPNGVGKHHTATRAGR